MWDHFVWVEAEIHHSDDIWWWDFKQVHTFHRASNKLPLLTALKLPVNFKAQHKEWSPHMTHSSPKALLQATSDVPALTAMEKCCCPGWLSEHPAFVMWDRDGEYKTELAQLKGWWAQYGLSKAYEKCGFMQTHGCSCCWCVCAWYWGKLLLTSSSCPLILQHLLLAAWLWDLLVLREELGSRLDWIWDWQRRRSRSKSITCCDFRGR